MELSSAMALTTLGGIVNEHDTRLMRIIRHYVNQARDQVDMSQVCTLGVDETSNAKGHDYVSTFIDIPQSRVLFVTHGKDNTTVKRFSEDLHTHGGNVERIEEVCADLSPAYQKGVSEYLPNAEIVFDRFHIMKLVNEALDAVRRAEQKENPLLTGSRYAWLHNPETATEKQTERLQTLTKLNLKTVRAYQIRLALRDVYEIRDAKIATAALKRWYFWATHSRIEPVKKAENTIQ
jgi:transposase